MIQKLIWMVQEINWNDSKNKLEWFKFGENHSDLEFGCCKGVYWWLTDKYLFLALSWFGFGFGFTLCLALSLSWFGFVFT